VSIFAEQGVLAAAVASAGARERAAVLAIEASHEVERLVHEACGLTGEDVEYINEEWGQHPAEYPNKPCTDAEVAELKALYGIPMDDLIDRLVALHGASKSIVHKNFIADRRLEILSHAFERHPSALHQALRNVNALPPGEPRKTATDLFSYLVGAAFGRWDVRTGRHRRIGTPPPDLFDPVASYSPGMLVGPDGRPAVESPANYSLEMPPGRLLVDEPGHQWDVEAAILRVANALFSDGPKIVADLLEILGSKSIRDHLRRQFFKDHLSRYSKSRRKAPIYWPLSVPSKNWTVWTYAPMLTREMLYAVASEAGRRERLANEAMVRLQHEQKVGSAGRPNQKIAAELDAEESLSEELRRFRTETQRVAGLGWEPNLDDGILLCAAPLAELFQSWPDAITARTELRKGLYQWATVAKWAKQL
jgi:hypothetical protein